MSEKQLCLYDLPEATSTASNPTRAYLFGMNQHSVQLYLRDSSVTFESMMTAMKSSMPPTHSEAALTYLGPLQLAARLHLSDRANLEFCGYYSVEKSKTHHSIPDAPANRPPDVSHALFKLKPREYICSFCPSDLNLSSRDIDLSCSAQFAFALPQSVKPTHSSRSADTTLAADISLESSIAASHASPQRKDFCRRHRIDPSSRTTSAATYTGSTDSTDFADDVNLEALQSVFGAAPFVSVLNYKSLVSIDASPILKQFFKQLFWYFYLHTVSLSYTDASAFIADSALFTTSLQ